MAKHADEQDKKCCSHKHKYHSIEFHIELMLMQCWIVLCGAVLFFFLGCCRWLCTQCTVHLKVIQYHEFLTRPLEFSTHTPMWKCIRFATFYSFLFYVCVVWCDIFPFKTKFEWIPQISYEICVQPKNERTSEPNKITSITIFNVGKYEYMWLYSKRKFGKYCTIYWYSVLGGKRA